MKIEVYILDRMMNEVIEKVMVEEENLEDFIESYKSDEDFYAEYLK